MRALPKLPELEASPMAVTKRQVAKLVLATTVLASAGASVYFFTTGGWFSAWSSHAPTAELVVEKPATFGQPAPQSKLDAVASAWADPPTNNATQSVVQADYVTAVPSPNREIDRYATNVA